MNTGVRKKLTSDDCLAIIFRVEKLFVFFHVFRKFITTDLLEDFRKD